MFTLRQATRDEWTVEETTEPLPEPESDDSIPF
jgi:hypothetical protein